MHRVSYEFSISDIFLRYSNTKYISFAEMRITSKLKISRLAADP